MGSPNAKSALAYEDQNDLAMDLLLRISNLKEVGLSLRNEKRRRAVP